MKAYCMNCKKSKSKYSLCQGQGHRIPSKQEKKLGTFWSPQCSLIVNVRYYL